MGRIAGQNELSHPEMMQVVGGCGYEERNVKLWEYVDENNVRQVGYGTRDVWTQCFSDECFFNSGGGSWTPPIGGSGGYGGQQDEQSQLDMSAKERLESNCQIGFLNSNQILPNLGFLLLDALSSRAGELQKLEELLTNGVKLAINNDPDAYALSVDPISGTISIPKDLLGKIAGSTNEVMYQAFVDTLSKGFTHEYSHSSEAVSAPFWMQWNAGLNVRENFVEDWIADEVDATIREIDVWGITAYFESKARSGYLDSATLRHLYETYTSDRSTLQQVLYSAFLGYSDIEGTAIAAYNKYLAEAGAGPANESTFAENILGKDFGGCGGPGSGGSGGSQGGETGNGGNGGNGGGSSGGGESDIPHQPMN